MITKYGYGTLSVMVVIAAILVAVTFLFQAMPQPVKYILYLLALVIVVFSLNFFRDPERTAPGREDVIVSPADGRVLLIKEVDEQEFIKGKATQISVFMSPLNVHVNRIPVDGTVEYVRYQEGEFIVAFDDKASERNERSIIGINSKFTKVLFTQVSGFVARRIIYEVAPGDTVKQGERFGMIKFGSRVDVIVPHPFVPVVKKDDIITAGETVLFKLAEDKK